MTKGLVVIGLVKRHLTGQVEDLQLPPPHVLAQRRRDGFLLRSMLARSPVLFDERILL